MNELKVSAVFRERPPEEVRRRAESELQGLLALLFPQVELQTRSGEGSWWVEVVVIAGSAATWVALEVASWHVGKVLDGVYDRNEQDSTSGSAAPQVTALSRVNEHEPDGVRVAAAMRSIMEVTGATTVIFSEWSNKAGAGRIIYFSRGDGDSQLDFSFHQTDSRDDFNARTEPRLRIK